MLAYWHLLAHRLDGGPFTLLQTEHRNVSHPANGEGDQHKLRGRESDPLAHRPGARGTTLSMMPRLYRVAALGASPPPRVLKGEVNAYLLSSAGARGQALRTWKSSPSSTSR
jgi:hypothetical protein